MIWLLVFGFLIMKAASTEQYDLPVIPPSITSLGAPKRDSSTGKYIPQRAWIAVRNVSDNRPSHMEGPTGFVARNSNWKINFCDNDAKDKFMEENYAGSSILWAYNILNPVIGTSKVEIWRLAVLYLHGGYMLI